MLLVSNVSWVTISGSAFRHVIRTYVLRFCLAQDIFDYEIDSDDEWEDPGEGEDIVNSEGVSDDVMHKVHLG